MALYEERSPILTANEQELRRRFVHEYMKDFSPYDAAVRLGYAGSFAEQYARQFLSETFTLQLIDEQKQRLGLCDEQAEHKRRIVAGLYKEASCPFNSGAARVGAYSQLSRIFGIEAPAKTQEVLPSLGASDLNRLPEEDLVELERILSKAHEAHAAHQASPTPVPSAG